MAIAAPRAPWREYAFAIGVTLATVGCRLAIGHISPTGESGQLLLVLPIIISAYAGGLGPGLLATLVAALCADYFLIDGRGFSLSVSVSSLEWIALIASGLVISVLCEKLHRSRLRILEDVAGLEQADAARREQAVVQDRLSAIVATAPGVIYSFRLRPDGTACLPYASGNVSSLFDLDPETLARDAAPVFDRMAEEDAARVRAVIAHSASTLTPWRDEFRVRHSNGRELWIEGHSVPQREPDGSVLWHGVLNDVTERKRVEQSLRASEERYRDLVHVSPVAVFVNRDNHIAFANPAALALFGAAATEEVLGRSIFELYHPEDHDAVRERIACVGRGEPVSQAKLRIIGLDGRVRHVETVAAQFRDREGPAIQVVLRDMTERRQAETAILEREERLSAIVQSAMDGIITVDDSYRIELVNPAAEKMFGYRAADLAGQLMEVLMPERYRAAHRGHISKFSATYLAHRTMVNPGSQMGLRSNGEEFPLEASISQSEVGGQKLFTVILRDITERRRTEQALKAGEERFRQLAETIREVFWLTDPGKGEMVYISPAYEAIWGRTCQSLYDSPRAWLEAIHPEDRERVLQAALTQQAAGTYHVEYRIVRPDGSVRWIQDKAFPVLGPDGQVSRIAGLAEDITDRRALEEQFRQTQRMESIGQLAGGVAHDFNNLLTVITASADMLGMELPSGDSTQELVQEIQHASQRAASLTRQLLAFSRQEVIEPKIVDLSAVVGDTEKMLRRLIGEDVLLTTNLCPSRCPVRIDAGQWGQVLLNLAVNARDAMPRGGRLTIDTTCVELDDVFQRTHPTAAPGRYAKLAIADTGCGMTPEIQSRMFEPFFTTKGRGKGTGLGLAVVYGIVQQSGGMIDVSSEPGTGTVFTIYLPTVSDSPAVRPETGRSLDLAGTETILLVEDEDAVRRVATRVLERKGYQVFGAADGREALELLEGHKGSFDLLLSDVVLPAMDGPSVAEAVRARHPNVRVLFASGYMDDAVTRRGVLAEEGAFLQKPYSPSVLLRRIREMLDPK
jgi:two-component system, cell cycle sensor histidine kinase and response regulator CckA